MDYKGKRFGKWTVIGETEGLSTWYCECECGTRRHVPRYTLLSGASKSCGCSRYTGSNSIGERTRKHGDFGTRLYGIWAAMKRRCYNPNVKFYHDYGGRGITVCDEWLDYIPFKEWALANGYEEGLTIDRIDVNGNYCPENCRWVTQREQCNNTRKTRIVEYNGKKYTMREIADITGLKIRTIQGRYERGWTPEQIFSNELKKNQY